MKTIRPGRPSASHTVETVARVEEIIRPDRRLTIREVAHEVRTAFSMCYKILTEDLQMRRVTTKYVPHLLMAGQKDDCVSICTDLHKRAQNDPNYMSSELTGDNCRVYRYNLETKQMSSQWDMAPSPRPKKARQVKSNVKTMLLAFFDTYGLVCNASMTLCADIALRSGAVAIGSCTMTRPLPTGLSSRMNLW